MIASPVLLFCLLAILHAAFAQQQTPEINLDGLALLGCIQKLKIDQCVPLSIEDIDKPAAQLNPVFETKYCSKTCIDTVKAIKPNEVAATCNIKDNSTASLLSASALLLPTVQEFFCAKEGNTFCTVEAIDNLRKQNATLLSLSSPDTLPKDVYCTKCMENQVNKLRAAYKILKLAPESASLPLAAMLPDPEKIGKTCEFTGYGEQTGNTNTSNAHLVSLSASTLLLAIAGSAALLL
ncbi:hypothetical protein BKA69DRAFT_1063859 [Paraphysoderma sedebokerense]|nr:hypothetical protein BKA69DRAFT_1063859 [Paraphysoderma sedebokerense]